MHIRTDWIDRLSTLQGEARSVAGGVEYRLLANDIWENCLHVPAERRSPAAGRELAATMRHLGWELKNIRIGNAVGRGYVRREPMTHVISLRVTDEEAAALAAQTAHYGLTASDVIRRLILAGARALPRKD